MTTEYLVDPWIIDLQPNDGIEARFSRLNALAKIQELQVKYGLMPVGFINDEFVEEFKNDYSNYHRDDGRALANLIAHLVFSGDHQGQITTEEETLLPADVPLTWLQSLDRKGSTLNPPNWRRPMIFIPEERTGVWPNLPFFKYATSSGEEMRRNLVCLESYEQHQYCEPDIDPWRIGAVGTLPPIVNGTVAERHDARCRLPRPEHILPLHFSFDEIVDRLSRKIDWACGQHGYAYYIPEEGWNPQNIQEGDWRNSIRIFNTRVVEGGRRGPVDRKGRIWLWDQAKNVHWDVQLPGGGHVNVSPEGLIL